MRPGAPMSKTDGQPRGRPPHRTSTSKATFEPDDWQPPYTRSQLIRFDNRFRSRLLWAFRGGLERRESAAAAQVEPTNGNEPLRRLTARRHTARFQDLAGAPP